LEVWNRTAWIVRRRYDTRRLAGKLTLRASDWKLWRGLE
jgi:hypothetical protein